MKDIEMAIEAEKLYIENINPNKNILNYIGQWGYSDLGEFYRDKQKYLRKKLKFNIYDEIPLENIEEVYTNIMINKTPTIFFHTAKKIFMWCGVGDRYNEDYVKENNIEVHKMLYGGGNIINNIGDLSGGILFPQDLGIHYKDFADLFVKFLSKKFPNIEMDIKTNDILFDGKKVIGFGTRNYSEMDIVMFQMNFSDKTELIKNICGLNENKLPGYMPNLDVDEVKGEIISWLN